MFPESRVAHRMLWRSQTHKIDLICRSLFNYVGLFLST